MNEGKMPSPLYNMIKYYIKPSKWIKLTDESTCNSQKSLCYAQAQNFILKFKIENIKEIFFP